MLTRDDRKVFEDLLCADKRLHVQLKAEPFSSLVDQGPELCQIGAFRTLWEKMRQGRVLLVLVGVRQIDSGIL